MNYKTTPYAHQLECLKKFGRKEAFALLAEMGTGKTKIIIDNIADLWETGDCDAVLIFAPNGVHTNWTRLELPKHMPDEVLYISHAWTSSKSKKEETLLKSITQNIRGRLDGNDYHFLRVVTMNWEALQTKRGFDFAKRFLESSQRAMIVCDESDAMKNPKATRTKNLMKLKPLSVTRRIMTGTPINNAPFDAFSQFSFLHPDILGTTSFYAFKCEYAQMLSPDNPLVKSIRAKSRFTPQIVARGVGGRPKYRNLDKLAKLIAPHSYRVLKSECLDLPDKIYKTILFDMTKQQQEVYDKAKNECRLLFEGEDTPFNKLVAMTKLAQITSGYYIHPMSEEPVRIDGPTPKLDLTIDRIQKIIEQGDKVIVWARYRIEIADIVERLNEAEIKSVEYHGGVSKSDRVEAIDSFESGDAQVFVGNQQAGGTGITLVAANYVIYFSNNFSLRDRLQSEDRCHRIGQTRNVTYINVVAKDSIDEVVVSALSSKKDVADAILEKGMEGC